MTIPAPFCILKVLASVKLMYLTLISPIKGKINCQQILCACPPLGSSSDDGDKVKTLLNSKGKLLEDELSSIPR